MGLIGQLAMRLNFGIRRHPSRWLYTDALLGKYIDPNEQPFFTRDWGKSSVWDIGASVGKYTTILAKHSPQARIYAFEPNLNSLYYLAYRTAQYPNVVIVPNAVTVDGQPMKGTHEPDFNAPATGPLVATVAVKEAIAKYGVPTFVKMDIEGGEFPIFEGEAAECFKRSTVLVSWHPQLTGKPVPAEVKGWKNEHIASDITLLTPL